jgi:hypothetical protein
MSPPDLPLPLHARPEVSGISRRARTAVTHPREGGGIVRVGRQAVERHPARLAWNPRKEVLAVNGLGDGRILAWDPLRSNAQYLPESELNPAILARRPAGEVLAAIHNGNIVRLWRPAAKPARKAPEDAGAGRR